MRSKLASNGGQHPGLLLQRYFDGPRAERDKPGERRTLFKAVVDAGQCPGLEAVYGPAFSRWKLSLPEGTKTSELATVSNRLIIGLGSQNVLETGLTLHHTYGVPIIPGSALKGLAAHYCAQAWGASEPKYRKGKDSYHQLMFGNTGDGGVIAFHDAWLLPESLPTTFTRDVMTPHHPNWQKEDSPAPTDFDSPTPISYLSVRGTFLVAVSWAGPEHEQSTKWTGRAMELLVQALSDWGVGGKTSSGYGRLSDPKTSTTGQGTAAPAQMPPSDGKVEVTILEHMPKTGANAFRVQEEGKGRGMLNHGIPLSPLPEVGAKVRVIWDPKSGVTNPAYRWSPDVPVVPPKRGGTSHKSQR